VVDNMSLEERIAVFISDNTAVSETRSEILAMGIMTFVNADRCATPSAELDAEGLPPLPKATALLHKPSAYGNRKPLAIYTADKVRQAQRDAIRAVFMEHSELNTDGLPPLPPDPLCRDDTEHDINYYTADQVRQAQRDAIALGYAFAQGDRCTYCGGPHKRGDCKWPL